MEQAAAGNAIYFCGDHVRVTFNIPIGANAHEFFMDMEQRYRAKMEETREKLSK